MGEMTVGVLENGTWRHKLCSIYLVPILLPLYLTSNIFIFNWVRESKLGVGSA